MVNLIAHTFFALLLLVGAAWAVVSRNRRGLLWGSTLTTIGLVGTLWLSEIGAITSLLAIVFLVFDFFVFTFSGSIRLLPKTLNEKPTVNIYPALVVWFALVFLAVALFLIWSPQWQATPTGNDLDHLLADVLRDLWGHRAFSLYLIVGLIFGVSVGSFFMIEREKTA